MDETGGSSLSLPACYNHNHIIAGEWGRKDQKWIWNQILGYLHSPTQSKWHKASSCAISSGSCVLYSHWFTSKGQGWQIHFQWKWYQLGQKGSIYQQGYSLYFIAMFSILYSVHASKTFVLLAFETAQCQVTTAKSTLLMVFMETTHLVTLLPSLFSMYNNIVSQYNHLVITLFDHCNNNYCYGYTGNRLV